MIETALGTSIAFTAPHRLASKAGYDILEAGGTAVEAMVAAAAQIAVVYPHMNSIGGDGFWLIKKTDQSPVAISACGPAAQQATPEWYEKKSYKSFLPTRGPLAALTVPGTIAGWKLALELDNPKRAVPLNELLSAAVERAKNGVAVTKNQHETLAAKKHELISVSGFKDFYLDKSHEPEVGSKLLQTKLGETLEHLGRAGRDHFYTGRMAKTYSDFLISLGSPLRLNDF